MDYGSIYRRFIPISKICLVFAYTISYILCGHLRKIEIDNKNKFLILALY